MRKRVMIRSKLLSALLVLVMVFAFVPFSALTAFAVEPEITEVSSFEQLVAAVNADKAYIKLTGDIERVVAADELPPRLIFDGNVDYVLDLNGYSLEVINHINEYYTGKFAMITVSGESSLEIKNGYIGFDNWSTGSDRKSKGVVFVEDTATLVATKVSMRNLYTGAVVSAAEQASVTLDGGEYQVQNGFALFLSGQAALTLDGSVYIHTLVGDCASSAYVDGYGALYSESAGALVINNAFFKSGIQVHSSQIGAFSTATHEVMVNGKVLTEDIFDGTRSDAQNQNKEYYWYAFNGKALNKTEDSGFCNTVRVISYDKKYPIEITSGTAMVGGAPVTEASYGQTVTIVAGDPAPGKEFLRWGTTGALLGNDYTATTSFVMPAQPVALTAYYGNLAISAVELNVTAPVAGEKPNFQASAAGDVTTDMMEWFVVGGGALGENDVFFPGVQYGVRVLIYPGEDYKFADAVAPTVNGLTAQIQAGTAAYQIVEYHFAALPASVFTTYYKSSPQLGVGGKIELDVDAITGASDTFADALAAGKVSYQWYRNGQPIEGANASEYAFVTEDIGCNIFARVSADGVYSYGSTVVVTGDLYHVYFNMTEAAVGGRAPQITSATPGIAILADSTVICEMLGPNSPGLPLDMAKAILLPGKTYRIFAYYQTIDAEINVGINASFYVNGNAATKDGDRVIYEFTMPAADFDVTVTSDDAIGIGAMLKATEVSGATYQWFRNGEPITGATSPTYIVTAADKNSLLHCVVTKADGSCGYTSQVEIGQVITVLRFEITNPQNNTTKSAISKSVSIGSFGSVGWMFGTIDNLGDALNGDDKFAEGSTYVGFFQVVAPEGLWFVNGVTQTKAYCNGTLVGVMAGCDVGCLNISFMFEFTAIHKHEYSDDVWAHDDEGCWNPCIVPGCPAPNEEWVMYTDHEGNATCKDPGTCVICGATYYYEDQHDVAVPNYVYIDDMKCGTFCATEGCDYLSSWSYHTGGVATCTSKAVCEICHHEYGEPLQHAGGTATCTQKALCTACGEAYGELGGHAFGEWIAEIPATTEAAGSKGHKDCSVCQKHFDENDAVILDLTIAKQTPPAAPDASDNPDQPDNPDNSGTTPPADNPPSDDEGGLGAGAVVGIVVGSVAVAGVGGFAVFWFVIKKKSFADLIAVFKK